MNNGQLILGVKITRNWSLSRLKDQMPPLIVKFAVYLNNYASTS